MASPNQGNPPALHPRPLILALSGGGFRGYYTALVLAEIERLLKAPCSKIFDLIAGTSIGGIIALGLSNNIPAHTIAEIIRDHGSGIFPTLPLVTARRVFAPPYKSDGIKAAFKALLPNRCDAPISTSSQRVLVVAASPVSASIVPLCSWATTTLGSVSILDAALATSAAPTYFPAHHIQFSNGTGMDLIDGGIAANAPDALAIHHAVAELGFPNEISVLSIGTCARPVGGVSGRNSAGMVGALRKLGGAGIIELMMSIQEQRGIADAVRLTGHSNHLRIDGKHGDAQAKHLGLDNASRDAQRVLQELALATSTSVLPALGSNNVWQLMHAYA